MRLLRLLIIFTVALVVASPAVADESALNKEGFWNVGRGDAGAKGCMVSTIVADGAMFLIQVAPGHVDFVVSPKTPMRKGKAGVLIVGDERFDFEPNYTDDRTAMFVEDVGGRALAAARKARNIAVMIDGRELVHVNVEKTGFEGALDAVTACSKGEKGWWGEGVAAPAANDGEPPLNKEGFWSLQASEDSCSSVLRIEGGFGFVLIVTNRGQDFMVGAGSDAGFKNGRKATLETGAFSLPFKPDFADKRTYVQLDKFMDRQAATRLQDAKLLAIYIDGAEAISADVGETGMRQLVDDLAACGRGQKGWWGEGAKVR